jgi:hypothetical protein
MRNELACSEAAKGAVKSARGAEGLFVRVINPSPPTGKVRPLNSKLLLDF